DDITGIRSFLALNQLEQGGLAGTVAADDTDNGTGRYAETQVFVEQLVVEALADAMKLDDLVTQAWTRRNVDFVGLIALLEVARLHFLEARQARLALGLASLGVGANPFQLMLDRFLTRGFLLGFPLQTLLLGFQPLGI